MIATTLWMVGYAAWPVAKRANSLVETLNGRGVTRLVDVRLSPCSSDIQPGRTYGPKAWSLQEPGQGIAALLGEAGVQYEWLVELGNPQRQDPLMRVLRSHLSDETANWPVHRGLARLAEIVRTPREVVAILCTCSDGRHCHRTVVAKALNERHFAGKLELREAREQR